MKRSTWELRIILTGNRPWNAFSTIQYSYTQSQKSDFAKITLAILAWITHRRLVRYVRETYQGYENGVFTKFSVSNDIVIRPRVVGGQLWHPLWVHLTPSFSSFDPSFTSFPFMGPVKKFCNVLRKGGYILKLFERCASVTEFFQMSKHSVTFLTLGREGAETGPEEH